MNKVLYMGLTAVLLALVPTTQIAAEPQQALEKQAFHAEAVNQLNLDFELTNATGYDIASIQISPANEEDWGEDILEEILADGETIQLSFHPEATAKRWDLQITWDDGDGEVYWKGLNLTEISQITLYYDVASGKTTARIQ